MVGAPEGYSGRGNESGVVVDFFRRWRAELLGMGILLLGRVWP